MAVVSPGDDAFLECGPEPHDCPLLVQFCFAFVLSPCGEAGGADKRIHTIDTY